MVWNQSLNQPGESKETMYTVSLGRVRAVRQSQDHKGVLSLTFTTAAAGILQLAPGSVRSGVQGMFVLMSSLAMAV